MKDEIDENDFYEYIDKLREIYEKKPKKATKEAKASLERLKQTKKQLISDNNKVKLYICLYFVFLALIGLVNINIYPMYLFGLIFFAAGSLVGLNVPGFGLIFLFSHGGSGIGVILGTMLGPIFESPIMSDNPVNLYICLGGIGFLILLGTILSILYNLSEPLKDKKNFILVPLVIFGIAITLTVILSTVVSYKFGINYDVFWN